MIDRAPHLWRRHISALPGQQVPGYTTANARAAWRMTSRLEVALAGQNLFQAAHEETAGEPGPPVLIRRSGHISVTWRP